MYANHDLIKTNFPNKNLRYFIKYKFHLVAQRLAKEYNIPVINAGDSIRWILNDPSHMHTSLATRIREQFNRGECISDELTAQAIQTLLMNGIYFTRG